MKIYLYCSHKYSPVGFQLGIINKDEDNNGLLSLVEDNSKSLIERLFICSGLLSAFGKISDNKWCCLLKKIDGYKNIAIELGSFEEFKTVKENLANISKTKLINLIDNFIDTEADDTKFGYKVKKSELEKLKKQLLQDVSLSENSDDYFDSLILELNFKKDLSELAQNLNLEPTLLHKESDTMFIYGGKKKLVKKKESEDFFQICLAILLIFVIISAIWILLRY